MTGYAWTWIARTPKADGTHTCLYRGYPIDKAGWLPVPPELRKVDRASLRVEGETVRLASVAEQAAVAAVEEASMAVEQQSARIESLVSAESRVQALTGALVRAANAGKDAKALEDALAAATKAADDLAKALP